MTADTATDTRREGAQTSAAGDASPSPSLMVLASDAVTVAKSFLELAALEVRLALQTLPKILGLLVIAFLLSLFAWLSFSTAAGWLAYVLLGSVGWGIAGFLLLQIVALIACRFVLATYMQRVSLPHTRDFVKNMQENFREAAR